MQELLSDAEIAARIAALDVDAEGGEPAYKYVRSLASIGQSLIEALQVEDGIGLGLSQVDVLTRGFRPSDLVLVTGFAHSGKTQLVNTMIHNNPNKKVLFFSLDDPAEMILAKLVAMRTGVSAERIEAQVRAGDPGAKRLVLETAEKYLPNLIVIDDVIGISSMQEAVDEATAVWGVKPDAVVIDYVEMMPGNGYSDDQAARVKDKLTDLKKWAKVAAFPLIALHQGTRSNARPGEAITLLSLGFSGEQQATIVIGCRRKREKDDMEGWERQHHENSITVHVVKNKRPGGRMTHYDGVDFHMEATTGLISPEQAPGSLTATNQVQQLSMNGEE